MDSLLDVLREHAALLEDFTTPQDEGWQVFTNSDSTRVNARTKAVLADPDAAWSAAKDLRDKILALGYALHGDCSVGVWSEIGDEPAGSDDLSLPIVGWRGYLDINFETR